MLICVVFLCASDYPGDSTESVAPESHHMNGWPPCLPGVLRSDIQPLLLRHRLPLSYVSGPNVRSIPSKSEEMTDVRGLAHKVRKPASFSCVRMEEEEEEVEEGGSWISAPI